MLLKLDFQTTIVICVIKYNMIYFTDFRRRFVSLLSYQFKTFKPSMALSILQEKNLKSKEKSMYDEAI